MNKFDLYIKKLYKKLKKFKVGDEVYVLMAKDEMGNAPFYDFTFHNIAVLKGKIIKIHAIFGVHIVVELDELFRGSGVYPFNRVFKTPKEALNHLKILLERQIKQLEDE